MTASKNLVLILVAAAIAAAGYVLSGGAGEGPSSLGNWETVERIDGGGAGDGLAGPGQGESPREILATPVRDVEIPEGTEPGSGTTVVYPLEVELTLLLPGEVEVSPARSSSSTGRTVAARCVPTSEAASARATCFRGPPSSG